MSGGEDAQEAILLERGFCLERCRKVCAYIAVAQHHALCLSGGAGSVDYGGKVIWLRILHPAVALEVLVVLLDELEGLYVNDKCELLPAFLAQFPHHALGNEQHF